MNDLLINLLQGLTAFIATNLDDIVVLMIFLANPAWRVQQVIFGQYLGFGVLVILSLPGYLGGMLIPTAWIGLLGLVPLGIGLKLLFSKDDEDDTVQTFTSQKFGGLEKLLPLPVVQVILLTFGIMVGIWCWLAGWLVQQHLIGNIFSKYGDRLIPWVFMGLGIYILWESKTLPYFFKSYN
jgi:cadmium resistance protein CadD (predicted permease)